MWSWLRGNRTDRHSTRLTRQSDHPDGVVDDDGTRTYILREIKAAPTGVGGNTHDGTIVSLTPWDEEAEARHARDVRRDAREDQYDREDRADGGRDGDEPEREL